MKRDTTSFAATAVAVLACPFISQAQSAASGAQGQNKNEALSLRHQNALTQKADENLYRFTIGPTLNFGISARFDQLGAFPSVTGNTPGQYEDGWVQPDVLNIPAGTSSDWGYYNAGQLAGNLVSMNRSYSAQDAVSDRRDADVGVGFDLGMTRALGKLSENCTWGISATLGYTRAGLKDNGDVVSGAYRQTDTFDKGLLVIPNPKTTGTPNSGTMRIPTAPTSSTTTYLPNSTFVSGSRNLDIDLVGMRLGPYLEYRLTEKLLASLSGGLALAYVGMEYRFDETSVIPSMNPVLDTVHVPGLSNTTRTSGSDTDNSFRAGAFVQGTLTYEFTKKISGFVGAEYQYLGTANRVLNNRGVNLDLGKVVFLKLGAGYSF